MRRKNPEKELAEIKDQAFNPDEMLTLKIRRLDFEVVKSVLRERGKNSFDATDLLLITDVILRIESGMTKPEETV